MLSTLLKVFAATFARHSETWATRLYRRVMSSLQPVIMRRVSNWVRNSDIPSGCTAGLVNPATGQTFGTATSSRPAHINAAVAAASAALPDWADTTPGDRAALLLGVADRLTREDGVVAAEIAATGKPEAMVRDEIAASADVFRFFAGACRTVSGPAAGAYSPRSLSWVQRRPVGVVAAITPWNYPLMMAAWKIAPAVAAGNTVVIKPAPNTPASTRILAELAAKAGAPPGVVNVVCGGANAGKSLVAHPGTDMVAFTGSVATGQWIAAHAGVKRTHLELGGNAPVIVFADADLEQAAGDVAAAGYGNAGQSCTAACRVVAETSIAGEFTELLVAATPALADSPLHTPAQQARVHDYVQNLSARARVAAGGVLPATPGWWYPPTVVTGVASADPIVQQEVFGPVVTIQTFDTDDEAVRVASGVAQRLAASVYTRDHQRALRMSGRLPFGWVGINACHSPAPELPHGGFGDSGQGVDLSALGLDAYTLPKTVTSRW